MSNWWNKYYKTVRNIEELDISREAFDEFCRNIEVACDNYGINYMRLYIAKPEYIEAFSDYGIDTAILTDGKNMPLVTLALDDNDEPFDLEAISEKDVERAIAESPIESCDAINASEDIDDEDVIQHVSVDIFNELADDYSKELNEHTDHARKLIEDQIYTEHTEYDFSPEEVEEIIQCVEDIVDDYFSTWEEHYGAASARKYGDKIIELYSGTIISKRIDDKDDNGPEIFGLRAVARAVGTQIYQILNALEGMCYENRACEVTDSYYFIGSWNEWETIKDKVL